MLLSLAGESVCLLADKAVWLPDRRALLISDLHLGKAGHFRKHGLGIPSDGGLGDLTRLSTLIEGLNPRHLYLLGDLFHAELNEEWEPVRAWLQKQSCLLSLIRGNHDILHVSVYQEAGINVVDQENLGNLVLSHEPLGSLPAGKINVSGHIRPGVLLKGKARQSLRLPCYYQQGNCLILPAFGMMTGLYLIPPKKEDNIYAIADGKVIQVL